MSGRKKDAQEILRIFESLGDEFSPERFLEEMEKRRTDEDENRELTYEIEENPE